MRVKHSQWGKTSYTPAWKIFREKILQFILVLAFSYFSILFFLFFSFLIVTQFFQFLKILTGFERKSENCDRLADKLST